MTGEWQPIGELVEKLAQAIEQQRSQTEKSKAGTKTVEDSDVSVRVSVRTA